jgi:CRISPR-associated endonuclease Csn1
MRVLGLDVGIATIGWALIELEHAEDARRRRGAIVACGVWSFDPPEEWTRDCALSKAQIRRELRGRRRNLRRRRQRMRLIRALFRRYGLLPSEDRDALRWTGLEPRALRQRALSAPLSPIELAVALGHIARRRGFKSNARRPLDPPVQAGLDGDRRGSAAPPARREELVHEARAILRAQASFAAAPLPPAFELEFMRIAFSQRPFAGEISRVGLCPFEPARKRTAKHSYSVELFRCLVRLNTLKISEDGRMRPLCALEISRVVHAFGEKPRISYADLRKLLGLRRNARFLAVAEAEEARFDFVTPTGAAVGVFRLRELVIASLGEEGWRDLRSSPERLDAIAEILTFCGAPESLAPALVAEGLAVALIEAIVAGAQMGKLGLFSGAAHISAKAAGKLVIGLEQGLSYDQACLAAGYDPASTPERRAFDVGAAGKEALKRILSQGRISSELVASPTARKALIEAVKQVKAVVERHGVPDRIHVELARDIGKSAEARRQIAFAAMRREAQKRRLRTAFQETLGRAPQIGATGAEELLRFELWREQNGCCLYSGERIDPSQLLAGSNSVQVDHILPWSRFGDDSLANKTLCMAHANQSKGDRTPHEWFKREKIPQAWREFVETVEALPIKRRKKRNILLEDGEALASRFRERNLNDTRWACRLLAEALKSLYPAGERRADGSGVRRVFTRPGALTDRLRRAFNLQGLKKREGGERIPDDRHHALDAILVAATTEATLNRAAREIRRETPRGGDALFCLDPPWPGFAEAARRAHEGVFVARAERRRARGKAHDATLRHVAVRGGQRVLFERKSVEDLKRADLDRVKDRERNLALIAALHAWIDAGKPADEPPRLGQGDPIRKVRLAMNERLGVEINTGNSARPASAARGGLVRLDVFRQSSVSGLTRYYFAPVYRHEVATAALPPMRVAKGGVDESRWIAINAGNARFEFLFSLHPMNLVEMTKPDGETILGYFRGFDRHTGALAVSDVADSSSIRRGIGARNLLRFGKLQVDRLGTVHAVAREPRLWRGEVCIPAGREEPRDKRPRSPREEPVGERPQDFRASCGAKRALACDAA